MGLDGDSPKVLAGTRFDLFCLPKKGVFTRRTVGRISLPKRSETSGEGEGDSEREKTD